MTYEELLIQNEHINITELDLSEVSGLKGLYFDGNIGIENKLTSKEKSCVLAEELGHHYTTYGNILNQDDISNRKQEYRARLYGYNLKVGLLGIIKCYENGCKTLHEMAELLDSTEEYLNEVISAYRNKYGMCTTIDNYVVYFYPSLGIAKIMS